MEYSDFNSNLPLLLGLVSFFTSFISAFIGMLGGSLMMLVLLAYFPADVTLQVYTVHIFINSLIHITNMKEDFEWKETKRSLPVILILTIVGIFFYKPLPLPMLKLGVSCFIFYAFYKYFRKGNKKEVKESGESVGKDYIWLSFATIINSLVGLSGPVLAMYFLDKGYSKTKFICAKSSVGLLLRLSACVIYYVHDGNLITNELAISLLVMSIASFLACRLAKEILNFVSTGVYTNLVKLSLGIATAKSLFSSISVAVAGM